MNGWALFFLVMFILSSFNTTRVLEMHRSCMNGLVVWEDKP